MQIENLLQQAIRAYKDPLLGTDFITSHILKKTEIHDKQIFIELQFGFPIKHYAIKLKEAFDQSLYQTIPQDYQITIQVNSKIVSHQVQTNQTGHAKIKNILAVASGKGGVGKSTVAVNLALALQTAGAHVGILDADIYGPSLPRMLGIKQVPQPGKKPKHVLPVMAQGLATMSIGYWVDDEQAMIWRGPMVSGALQQLINETEWPELDYLIVDLPPGTGDIQLTLAQKIPISGAIIITTPQELAVLDARKAYTMLGKVGIKVLGIVENMSYYQCKHCHHQDAIFGSGGGEKMALQYNTELLAKFPLDTAIQEQTDKGFPTVIAQPESALANLYLDLADKVAAQLSLQPRNFGQAFGKIEIERSE